MFLLLYLLHLLHQLYVDGHNALCLLPLQDCSCSVGGRAGPYGTYQTFIYSNVSSSSMQWKYIQAEECCLINGKKYAQSYALIYKITALNAPVHMQRWYIQKSSETLYFRPFSASLIQSYVQMSRHSFSFFQKRSSGHLIIIKPLSQLTTAQPAHSHLHTHELSGRYDSDRQRDTHSFQGHQKGFSVASSGNRFQTIWPRNLTSNKYSLAHTRAHALTTHTNRLVEKFAIDITQRKHNMQPLVGRMKTPPSINNTQKWRRPSAEVQNQVVSP